MFHINCYETCIQRITYVFCRCIDFTLELWQNKLSNDFHTIVYSFCNYLQLFWQDSNVFLQHHLPTRQTIVVAKDTILAVVMPRWQTLKNAIPAVAVTSGLLSTLGTILAPLHVFSFCPLPVLFSSSETYCETTIFLQCLLTITQFSMYMQ